MRLLPRGLRGVSEVWRGDHLWGRFYDAVVENEPVARIGWWLSMGTDVRLLYDATRELAALPAGAVVLDVPCGGGVALRGLPQDADVTYLAADISASMLRRTRGNADRRGVGVRCLQADVARLPLADGSVDLCVSFTGLHCVPDPAAAVREVARVLRPGGVLTGSAVLDGTGRRYDPLRVVGRAAGLMGPSGTPDDVRRWCADAGLVDLDLRLSGAMGYFRCRRA